MRIDLCLRVAAGAAFLACTSGAAIGQTPATAQYPTNDIPFTLSSGTVIRVRNVVVFRTPNGSELAVYIETPSPSTEPARVALEAKEVAGLQLKSPPVGNLTSVTVAVCRTLGCLQMKEQAPETFRFLRKPDGSLEAERQSSMTGAGADTPMMRIAHLLVGQWREPVCASNPAEGERIWYEGGDFCEWVTPGRGRIVAERDEQQRVHAITMNRETGSEANAHAILDSLATALRSFGLSERECTPGSSPAGAIRSWLYEGRSDLLLHIAEITPPAGTPRLFAVSVDMPDMFPRALCH